MEFQEVQIRRMQVVPHLDTQRNTLSPLALDTIKINFDVSVNRHSNYGVMAAIVGDHNLELKGGHARKFKLFMIPKYLKPLLVKKLSSLPNPKASIRYELKEIAKFFLEPLMERIIKLHWKLKIFSMILEFSPLLFMTFHCQN